MNGQNCVGNARNYAGHTSATTPVTRTREVSSGDGPPASDDQPGATAEPRDDAGSCPAWCTLPSGHRTGDDGDPHSAQIGFMDLPAFRDVAGRYVQIEICQDPPAPPVICLVDDDNGDDLLPPMRPADALTLGRLFTRAAATALTDAAPAQTAQHGQAAAGRSDLTSADPRGTAGDEPGTRGATEGA